MNKTIDNDRLILQYIMPLNEVILDFHDSLKSISSGYASFDYEDYDYQLTDIVKVIIKFYYDFSFACVSSVFLINYSFVIYEF